MTDAELSRTIRETYQHAMARNRGTAEAALRTCEVLLNIPGDRGHRGRSRTGRHDARRGIDNLEAALTLPLMVNHRLAIYFSAAGDQGMAPCEARGRRAAQDRSRQVPGVPSSPASPSPSRSQPSTTR